MEMLKLKIISFQKIILSCFILLFSASATFAQEKPKHPVPLMVSHLSKKNKILLYRKGAPKHSFFSKVICLEKPCRAFIGWRTYQEKHRFNGWEDAQRPEYKQLKKQTPDPLDSLFVPVPTAKTNPLPKKTEQPLQAGTPQKKQEIFILDEVLFEVNSYRLNEQHTAGLDSLIEILNQNKSIQIQIIGHTDASGNERYNLKLSRDRAEAVAIYLIDHAIDENRITFQGLGSSQPLVSNSTEEGRRKNRRVEIVMTR